MADIRASFGLPPAETVEFFRAKGYAVQARWDETWQQAHGHAFTVTKMMNGALLEEVRRSLDRVLSDGGTFEQWKSGIMPKLQQAGWYGRVEDREITGVDHAVFIGESRLRTIYDTNLRTARAAGKWQRIQALKTTAPYLMYDAVNDRRTRPLHRLWGGLDTGRPIILPVDHPCWLIYFPPCGWGCRCGVSQLSERTLQRRGLAVTSDAELRRLGWIGPNGEPGGERRPFRRSNGDIVMVPAGVDPGWAYNPGEHFLEGLVPPPPTGPLDRPYPIVGAKPPMPPARARGADMLIDPASDTDAAIDAFLSGFEGPTDGATVLSTDKLGEPLVLDESFFYRGGDRNKPKLDRGRIQAIRLIAEALRDPDEIWWHWVDAKGPDGAPRPRLSRRYVARFDMDGKERSFIVVLQYGQGGWRGVTAFKNSDAAYLDSDNVRGGVLAYRRAESE